MKPSTSAAVLIVIMSVATGFVDLRTRAYPQRAYTEFIPRVVEGSADAPERYRVLVPFTVHAFGRATGVSPATAWHLSRLVLFLAAYFAFFRYLRTWFPEPQSLLGTAIMAATLPLTFTNSWAHPDHAAELLLFTAGCHAAATGRIGWLAGILALATLNRETAVFLVPLYLVAGPIDRRRVLLTIGLGLEWAVIYLGLRLWRGVVHYDYLQVWRNIEFFGLLPANFDPYYRAYAYFGILLFGGLLFAAYRAWRPGAPLFATRALLIVPLVALVAFTISSVIETRIFTLLYPVVLPAVIFACGGADRESKTLRDPANSNSEP